MLSSIKRFLNLMDAYGIIYCHWKSNEHLQEALNGDTDLDMLFDSAQYTLIARVFAECDIKRFRATPLMQYNGIEDFIGFDQEKAKIWHVHTHYCLTIGEKHLKGYTIPFWGSAVLRNRIRGEENVWISSPADEYVLLLSRIALKLRWRDYPCRLAEDDRRELNWLKERTDRNELSEAAEEIAHQIRLRNLSGIIIVDFINMQVKENQEKLMKAFEEFVAEDPIKTSIVDMTKLNLVEITRKKARRPLYELVDKSILLK